jgi:phosphatidylglycerol:prolipoprotein diacylglycerol transferase
MARSVSFPGLGLEFFVAREALSFGPFTVYWYGIIVVSGIVLGCFAALVQSRKYGLNPERMLDLFLYSIIAAFVGARAYYVIFSWDYYSANPGEILQIWKGGIALYGGVIAAFAAAWLLCRAWGISFLQAADAAAPGLILGQAVGRWGNFVNMEAFGTNTSLPWGMTGTDISAYLSANRDTLASLGIAVDPLAPVHPTFLYESLWCFVGFLLLIGLSKRRSFLGESLLMYIGWYGLGRFWIEGLRTDSLMAGSLRVSQVLAAALVIAAISTRIIIGSRIRKNSLPSLLSLPGGDDDSSRDAENGAFDGALEGGCEGGGQLKQDVTDWPSAAGEGKACDEDENPCPPGGGSEGDNP